VITLNNLYKKIKDNKYKVLLIIIVTVISTLPIIMHNLPYGGDINFHLKRIEAITENIKHGYIGYPIYFKYLNNYGYGSGLFYPDLFLYIPAFLNIFGISLFTSYKIFLVLIKLASLISIYFSIKSINKNEKSALIAVILYGFSSYCFIDMFERGALAETITIVFIPLVIRGIYEIIFGDNKKYYILSFGMLGILFSHIISLYLITIFLILFTLFNIKFLNKEKIKSIIKAIIVFILIGSHFLLPLIEQMLSNKFYYSIQENVVTYNTVPILFLFFEFPYYTLMGYTFKRWFPCGIGIIYLLLCIKYIKNKEKYDRASKCFLISGIICLIFTTKYFWYIPFMKKIFSPIQFPYRIYILSTALFITCFTRVMKNINIKKIFLTCLLLFSLNLFYPFCNIVTTKLLKDEIMNGEYLPVEYKKENNNGKILNNCKIKYSINNNLKTTIEYKTECDEIEVEIPIIYYKGYEVKINDEKIKISKSENGLIKFKTNQKEGKISVFYKGTKLYNVTKYISITSALCIVIKKVREKKYEQKK